MSSLLDCRPSADLIRSMKPSEFAASLVQTALRMSSAQRRGDLSFAPTIDCVLADPAVSDSIGETGDTAPVKELVLLLVVAVGEAVLPAWQEAFPDRMGPINALEAAEAWADSPGEETSDEAAEAAEKAVSQTLSVWRGPNRKAAWAGRTVAWVTMAPKYNWPAIAALGAAVEVLGERGVVEAITRRLSDLAR